MAALADPVAFGGGTYALSFRTTPAGALNAGDTITITAVLGTDFFYDSTLFRIEAGQSPGVVPAGLSMASTGPAATDNSYYANQVTLTLADPIPASTEVTVTAAGVTNPGPGRYQISVSTSAQPREQSVPYVVTGSGRAQFSTFTDTAGTRAFMLYRPADWFRTQALIVDLPGCTETASVEARWSRFTQLAELKGFSVLIPQEDSTDNGANCWNWFDPSDWKRGSGEPAIIAGLTRAVVSEYRLDPDRVYVTGISAGGVMADIMGVTYPDLWAALGVYAGCEYEGLPCVGAPAVQPPEVAAEAALTQMGPRRKNMPVIVVHGDADELVPSANDGEVIQQWLYIDAVAAGRTPSSLPVLPTSATAYDQPGKQSAEIRRWYRGRYLQAEEIVVHGMAHQWSDAANAGTPEDALITDPAGPDVTTPIVDFFLSHAST